MKSELITPRKKRKLSNGIFKERLLAVKKSKALPRNWRKLIIAMQPEFDSYEGAVQMDNTYKATVINEIVVKCMEKIVKSTVC